MSNRRGAGTWIAGVAAAVMFAVGCGAAPNGDPGTRVEPTEQSTTPTTTDLCIGSAPDCNDGKAASCITVGTVYATYKAWACPSACTPVPPGGCDSGYTLTCQSDGYIDVGGMTMNAYEWWCMEAHHDDPGGCSGCKPAF